MPCPFCGIQVEYAIENSSDWYRDPPVPVYRIDCYDRCRQYWLEAISGHPPQIDPDIRAFLDSLNDAQRTFISASTQYACDNDILIVYNKKGLQSLITDWHYVKAAVVSYGLNNASFRISGLGFDIANMLFFVDAEDARFTLRLHQAGTAIDKIRSEIYWLTALRDKARIKTLSPVPGRDREMIQHLSPNDLPSRYTTVYDWIPGETLGALSAAEKTPELIRSLGVMVGRMHAVSETLELPDWFTRPRYYDIEWVRLQVEKVLASGNIDDSGEALAKLASLPSRFLRFVEEQGKGRDVFGLIHLDLAPHNIIVSEGQPCPIDMIQFGFGYYISDILTLSRQLSEDERTIFFEGYQEVRPLPKAYQQQLALFEEIRAL